MKPFFIKLNINSKEKLPTFISQIFRFGIVGLSNTSIYLLTYYLLIYFEINYVFSNIVAFILSVFNAYYWNNKYVFKKEKNADLKTFTKTFFAYGLTFVLSNLFLFVMVNYFLISKWISPLIVLCIIIPFNFLLIKFWAMD